MGLFQGKQQAKHTPKPKDEAEAVLHFFDENYRHELRESGRVYFEKAINHNASRFKHDLDATIASVTVELKDYMTTQLDATIAHVNDELTKRLDERMAASDRAAKDAQDLAVQSLNRNAQVLHDKYQQLSSSLQQTIASQEAMMITVFEENKARIMTTQAAQDSVLQSLKTSAHASQEQAKQLAIDLRKMVVDQEAAMELMLGDNKTRIVAAGDAQDKALRTLDDSVQVIQQQHEQLRTMLEKTVANQEEMLVVAFQDNMAQIVEHYLLGALGDQYDIKAQLPSIIKQMDTNKQAMMDDMKL